MIFRKVFTLTVLLLLGLYARADHVQSIGVWDDSGDPQSSFGLAFDSNVTSGNLIIAAARFQEDITPTVSDTRSSTWTLGQRCWNAGEGFGVIWYWAPVPSTGANTVTFSFSTANAQTRIGLIEESGVATVSPIDGNNCNLTFFSDNGTDQVTSGTFTPTEANTRIIGIALMNGSVTLAAGTSFTLQHGTAPTRTWIETRTLASAGLTSAAYTMATSTSLGGVIGLALKPASAPSSGLLLRRRRN